MSLALLKDGVPVVGVIDLPFLGTRFHASRGGAFQDGEPIFASDTAALSDALVSLGDYAVGKRSEEKNRRRLAWSADAFTALLTPGFRAVDSGATAVPRRRSPTGCHPSRVIG
ncbi:inositol monophosphatase family protein [Phytomonospora sp. NPDC050363]|uniref:inositol monophosphatase family protein n=1 Tax=Phytomonospora sp. NPDC050363 TaxID=3155642 RepID=UPI003406BCE1